MIKQLYIFFSLVLLSFSVQAQLSGTVSIIGAPSAKTSDWLGQFRKNRVLVTLANPRGQTYEAIISVKLFNGSGALIGETVDDQQTLLQISTGSNIYDLTNTIPNNASAFRLNDNSLKDKLQSGFIPEDNYQICVDFLDITNKQSLLNAPICRFANIIAFQAPILVYPPNLMEIQANSRPILRWNGVSPRPIGIVSYRLQVFEIVGTQSPEIAFRSNVPLIDEVILNQTQWIWGSSYPFPQQGKMYVWTVQALDEENKPIGEPNGLAVPFMFKVLGGTQIAGQESLTETSEYMISGKIIDLKTKKPVSGATVKLNIGNNPSVQTNAEGIYAFQSDSKPLIPSGQTAKISVSKQGFSNAEIDSKEIIFTKNQGKLDISINSNPVDLEGTVADEAKKVLGNVVVVLKQKNNGKTNTIASANTDNSGKFTFKNIPLGEGYSIEAILVGFTQTQLATNENFEVIAEKNKPLVVSMTSQKATIAGKVTEAKSQQAVGNLIVGVYTQADLTAYQEAVKNNQKPSVNPISKTVSTNNQGNYKIENVPINQAQSGLAVIVSSSDETYAPAWTSIDISKATLTQASTAPKEFIANLQVSVAQVVLTGIVTDKDNKPIINAKVELFDNQNKVIKSILTDGTGSYVINELPPLTSIVSIVFSKTDFKTLTQSASTLFSTKKAKYTANAILESSQDALLVVKGIVKDQFGKTLSGVTVSSEGKQATTDNSGNYSLVDLSANTQKTISFSLGSIKLDQNTTVQNSPNWRLDVVLLQNIKKFDIAITDNNSVSLSGVSISFAPPSGTTLQETANGKWTKEINISDLKTWIGKTGVLKISLANYIPFEQTLTFNSEQDILAVYNTPIKLQKADNKVVLSGKVIDEKNQPIAGATVKLAGGQQSVSTKTDGTFEYIDYGNPNVKPQFPTTYQIEVQAQGFELGTKNQNLSQAVSGTFNQPLGNLSLKSKPTNFKLEKIYGFSVEQASISISASGANYEVSGEISIPEGNSITTTSKKIKFQKLIADATGKIITAPSLEAEIAVVVLNISAKLTNPKITENTISGTIALNNIGIEGGGSVNGLGISIPNNAVITTTNFATSYNLTNITSAVIKGFTVTPTSNIGTLSKAEGLKMKGKVKILGADREGDFTLADNAKNDAQGQREFKLTNSPSFDFDLTNKQFSLKGKVTIGENSTLAVTAPSLSVKILGAKTMTDGTLTLNQEGKVQDGAFKSADKSGFKLLSMPLGLGNSVKVSSEDDKVCVDLAESSIGIPMLSKYIGIQSFKIYSDNVVTFQAKVGLTFGLDITKVGKAAAEGEEPKESSYGVSLELAALEGSFGSDTPKENFIFIDGNVSMSVPNLTLSAGSFTFYGDKSFKVAKLGAKLELASFSVEGELEFTKNEAGTSGIMGKVALEIPDLFSAESEFEYFDKKNWAISFVIKSGKGGIPLGLTGLELSGGGGNLRRAEEVWTVGVLGIITPITSKLPMASRVALELEIEAQVTFGGGELKFVLSGTCSVVETELAKVEATIDIKRKFFDLTMTAEMQGALLVKLGKAMVGTGESPKQAVPNSGVGTKTNTPIPVETTKTVTAPATTGTTKTTTVSGTAESSSLEDALNDIFSANLTMNLRIGSDEAGGNAGNVFRFYGQGGIKVFGKDVANGRVCVGNGIKAKVPESVADIGLFFDLEIDMKENSSFNFAIASGEIEFGYMVKAGMTLDLQKFNASAKLGVGIHASGRISVVGKDIAGAKADAKAMLEIVIEGAKPKSVSAAISVDVRGFIGDECADCNSVCRNGAKGCISFDLSAKLDLSNLFDFDINAKDIGKQLVENGAKKVVAECNPNGSVGGCLGGIVQTGIGVGVVAITATVTVVKDVAGAIVGFLGFGGEKENFVEAKDVKAPTGLLLNTIVNDYSTFRATWTKIDYSSMKQYHIDIATDQNFTNYLRDFKDKTIDQDAWQGFNVDNLEPNKKYYLRLRAEYNPSADGKPTQISTNSEVKNIQVPSLPDVQAKHAYLDKSDNGYYSNFKLSWSKITGIDHIFISIKESNTPPDTKKPNTDNTNLSTYNFVKYDGSDVDKMISGLLPGKTYAYTIWTMFIRNGTNYYSNGFTNTLTLPALPEVNPTASSVTGNAYYSDFKIVWNKITGIDHIFISVKESSTPPDKTKPNIDNSNISAYNFKQYDGSDVDKTISGLAPGKTYAYTIWTMLIRNDKPYYSTGVTGNFTMPTLPEVSNLANVPFTDDNKYKKYKITWSAPTGINRLRFSLKKGSTPPTAKNTDTGNLSPYNFEDRDGKDVYREVEGLESGQQYAYTVWTMVEINNNKYYSAGKTGTFTLPSIPTPPDVSNVSAAYIDDKKFKINWTLPSNRTNRLYITVVSGSSAPTPSTSGISGYSLNSRDGGDINFTVSPSGIGLGSTYSYTIWGVNQINGKDYYSKGVSGTYTVTLPSVINLTVTEKGKDYFKIKWDNNGALDHIFISVSKSGYQTNITNPSSTADKNTNRSSNNLDIGDSNGNQRRWNFTRFDGDTDKKIDGLQSNTTYYLTIWKALNRNNQYYYSSSQTISVTTNK